MRYMQMKKHFCCLLAIWMVLAGLCGCGAGEPVVGEGVASEMKTENRTSENQASEWEASDEQSPEVSDQESVIFTDDLGREVTVESHERVATLIGSFTDIWMLAGLGCINIADSDKSLLEDLSLEAIIAADPQYIFVTTQGNDYEAAMKNVEELFISNPAWASLSAVQNGNYYVLEKSLFNLKPNARWGEAYKILADILYPER